VIRWAIDSRSSVDAVGVVRLGPYRLAQDDTMDTMNVESMIEEFESRMAKAGLSIVVVTVSEHRTGFSVNCRPGASAAESTICAIMGAKLQEGLAHVAAKRDPTSRS
jgi:hypothetical protein